jgi:hypothetical protein
MPDHTATMPYVVGTRLTASDHHKLQSLCTHTQRPASDVLRLLIRLAQPVDVPPLRLEPAPSQEVPCATK